MSFYKELVPFIDYIHSIRRLENYLSFDMKFPIKWNMPKNMTDESQLVPFDTGVENAKGMSFVSKLDENEVSVVITKILKIVKYNKEREIKEKLFKDTVERVLASEDFICGDQEIMAYLNAYNRSWFKNWRFETFCHEGWGPEVFKDGTIPFYDFFYKELQ